MRILIVANKLPYPARDGGSIATLNMITGLHDAGHEVSCLSLNTRKHAFPVDKIPSKLSERIRFIGIDCDTSVRPLRLVLNLLFSRKAYIAERFNVGAFRQKLKELLQHTHFDLIQLEGPYTGHYLEEIRKWSSAALSLRAHNVEHMIWKKKAAGESGLLKRIYLHNMASRLERFEMDVVHRVDFLVAISPIDEAYFRTRGFSRRSITIPAGLPLKDYPLTPIPGDPSVFFIGALDWLPNQEGLGWFMENVFEDLVKELPSVTFHVAGRNAPARIEKLLRHDQVVYHGEVENATGFMQSYRVMVVPLLTGSGIRIKILEGMALGRPVVTTSAGIEGIQAELNRDVMVADDPEAFRREVVKLVKDDMAAGNLVSHARGLIQENFDTFGLSLRLSRFFNEEI